MAGILYLVGTPIGNLNDITFRAIETLKSVDLIACEDTRHSKILLDHYSISNKTTSYHKFNIKTKTAYLINMIKQGKNIALVADAGMPGISDPGQELVRSAVNEGIKVAVIPGASAALSALSGSGASTDRFAFEGFLPSKRSDKIKRIKALADEERTIIIYEAPHKLIDTLQGIRSLLGDRDIALARELTKYYEEMIRGKISDIITRFKNKRPRGEFVIIVEMGEVRREARGDARNCILLVKDMVKQGLSRSEAVKIASKRLNIPKNELYRMSLDD